MRYQVKEIAKVNGGFLEILLSDGLKTTDHVLHHLGSPESRLRFASRHNLDQSMIETVTSISDLVRVKGIGLKVAQDLVAYTEIRCVQDLLLDAEVVDTAKTAPKLAEDIGILARAKTIQDKLRVHAEDGAVKLSPQQLAEIIEEAAELHPRLSFAQPQDADNFARQAIAQHHRNSRNENRRFAVLFSGCGAMILAGSIGYMVYEYTAFLRRLGPVTPTKELLKEAHGLLMLGYLSPVVLVLFFTLALAASFAAVFKYSQYFKIYIVARYMFKTNDHRYAYLELNRLNIPRHETTFNAVNGMMILVTMAALVACYWFVKHQETGLLQTLSDYGQYISLILGCIICIPFMVDFHSKRTFLSGRPSFARKYYLSNLVTWFTIPIIFAVMLGPIMWQTVDVAGAIHTNYVIPRLWTSIESRIQKLRNLPTDSELNEEALVYAQIIESSYLRNLEETSAIVEMNEQDTADVTRLGKRAVLPLAVVATIILIVGPYIVITGLRRALFYLLLLYVGVKVERWFSDRVVQWFDVDTVNWLAMTLTGFAVLSTAVILDILNESVASGNRTCRQCNTETASESVYCPACSMRL